MVQAWRIVGRLGQKQNVNRYGVISKSSRFLPSWTSASSGVLSRREYGAGTTHWTLYFVGTGALPASSCSNDEVL